MSKDFIQNSEDWLKWRFQGLGASDAPIYFEGDFGNYSKYKTKKQLFHEKVYQEADNKKGNFITDMGHSVEEIARSIMELNLSFRNWKEVTLKSTCAISEDHPHLRASLDGYSDEIDLVWECKMCGKKKYEMIKEGECPDDFYLQTHHQMMVTGKDSVLLTAVWLQFNQDRRPILDYHETSSLYVQRDDALISDLKNSANNFWAEVLAKRKELGI